MRCANSAMTMISDDDDDDGSDNRCGVLASVSCTVAGKLGCFCNYFSKSAPSLSLMTRCRRACHNAPQLKVNRRVLQVQSAQ